MVLQTHAILKKILQKSMQESVAIDRGCKTEFIHIASSYS